MPSQAVRFGIDLYLYAKAGRVCVLGTKQMGWGRLKNVTEEGSEEGAEDPVAWKMGGTRDNEESMMAQSQAVPGAGERSLAVVLKKQKRGQAWQQASNEVALCIERGMFTGAGATLLPFACPSLS